MKSKIDYLYNGAEPLKIATVLLVVFAYLFIAVYGGASVAEVVRFFAFVLCYIYLPGKFFTSTVKVNNRFKNMSFSASVLLGVGFFVFLYCVSMRVPYGSYILNYFPLTIAVLQIYRHFKCDDKFISLSHPDRDGWLLILLWCALLLLNTFRVITKNALPSAVGNTLLNQDILWNVGNANSFKIRFIPEEIRYSGVQLHYHYLTEMFAGRRSIVTKIESYNIIVFYTAPYVLLCVVKCLNEFATTYFGKNYKSMLFTYSMFLFGCGSLLGCLLTGRSLFFNDNALHIITNINSQATAVIFLSIFSNMFIQLLETGFDTDFISIALWLSAFFMLSFGKGPVAAIVAIATTIVSIWLFVQKKIKAKGVLSGIILGTMFFVIYKFFFSSGANTSMQLSFYGTAGRTIWGDKIWQMYWAGNKVGSNLLTIFSILANTFLTAPLQMLLYIVGLFYDIPRLFKLDGRRLWANAIIAGGYIAFYMFNHYALSQAYFLFLAIFFLHLLAVENIQLLKNKKLLKNIAIICCAWGFATQAVMYVNFIGSGGRALVRNFGWDEKPHYPCEMTVDDEASMRFLKDNTDTNILFATNRIDTSIYTGDGISNVYSAFSGRQGYMEGYSYALTNMGVPYFVISQRKAVNERLFSDDTPAEELIYLCNATGITHIIFSAQFYGDETQLSENFEKIYDSQTVRIYKTGAQPLPQHPLYQRELESYVPEEERPE